MNNMKQNKIVRTLMVIGLLGTQILSIPTVFAEESESAEVTVLSKESETEATEEIVEEIIESSGPEESETASNDSEIYPVDETTPTDREIQKSSSDSKEVGVVEEADSLEETKEVIEFSKGEKAVSKEGITIDATNFPDDNFRDYIKNTFDIDDDNQLSDAEIADVTNIQVYGQDVQELTGIKLFTNLEQLDCENNDLTTIDVSGLTSLHTIYYSNNTNLQILDFRNCPNLITAHHSLQQETVYISAGMTAYVGCPAINEHTGNIVIDLNGYYTLQADGSKTVDLNAVLSPTLLKVFSQQQQPNFDKNTGILTIPKGEGKSTFEAGRDWNWEATHWTFYTNITNVDDVVVTFDSQGGSLVEAQTISYNGLVTEPSVPVKEQETFLGWYLEPECQTLWDFSQMTVAQDTTLYAKWGEASEANQLVVNFESNGGTPVVSQTLNKNEKVTKPENPTQPNYTFKGWYVDQELKEAWDFTAVVIQDMTLYAKWEKSDVTPEEIFYTVTFNTNGGSSIDSQKVAEKTAITKPTNPTKAGFTFSGWFADEQLTRAWDFDTKITSDVILFAKWEEQAIDKEQNDGDTTDKENTNNQKKNNAIASKKELPQTGETMSILVSFLGGCLIVFYWQGKKNNCFKLEK